MRGMIIGLSTLALMALPTLAVADGHGAVTGAAGGAVAGAVVGGPVGAAVGGVAGGVIGGAASEPPTRGCRPGPSGPMQYPDNDDDKQQYRRERYDDRRRTARIRQAGARPPDVARSEGRDWLRAAFAAGRKLC